MLCCFFSVLIAQCQSMVNRRPNCCMTVLIALCCIPAQLISLRHIRRNSGQQTVYSRVFRNHSFWEPGTIVSTSGRSQYRVQTPTGVVHRNSRQLHFRRLSDPIDSAAEFSVSDPEHEIRSAGRAPSLGRPPSAEQQLPPVAPACASGALPPVFRTVRMAVDSPSPQHIGQFTPHGSVATDSLECSTVGTNILKKGGNAVDAAVAATLCMGVVNLHVTGLGGGGFLIVYDHRKKKVVDIIDFRETAPSGLSESLLANYENGKAGLLVGVPGLLRGLGLAHRTYGQLPWSEVVLPSARVARNGFSVPTSLISATIRVNPGLNETIRLQNFLKNIEAGGNLTLPKLADSIEMIAAKGPDVLYTGPLANAVVSAVEEAGGIMKKEDLETYQPKRRKALLSVFGSFNIIVPDSPSGGPFLLETLKELDETKIAGNFTEMIQALAVAMQETYKTLFNSFGDLADNSSDYGLPTSTASWNYPEAVGSHVAAVDLNDLYVSVVSGLNTWFGSQLLTREGFVLNNAMENFNSGSNAFAPGKRPFSFATPIIAVQKEVCGRRLISGVGDAVIGIQLLVEYITREKNISTSMEAPRFHYNPVTNQIQYEAWHKPELSDKTLTQLRLLNYKVNAIREPYQSSNLIEKVGDVLSSRSDSRGGGVASRFR